MFPPAFAVLGLVLLNIIIVILALMSLVHLAYIPPTFNTCARTVEVLNAMHDISTKIRLWMCVKCGHFSQ